MKSRETSKNNPKISKLNNKFVQKHHILAYFLQNKRDFSAKSPLLLLALRPRLFNFVKNYQKSSFSSPKIVDASTILIGILSVFGVFFFVSPVSAASLTLTIPSNLSLNITPSVAGTFAKSDQPGTISVITDSEAGYTLGIKAKSDNSLTNGSDKLLSIGSPLDESAFSSYNTNNVWGFLPNKLYDTNDGATKDNTNFLPGPTQESSITLDKTSAPNSASANEYSLTLGAKVDSTIPSGAYSNTFIISATTNELPLRKLQEWGWRDCDALEEHEVVELEDIRDGNTYKVAKLKDGKCWMIENLRLGGDTEMELTSSTTDLTDGATFKLPKSNTNGFDPSVTDVANVYVDPEWGGYYTWTAATAGTGTHDTKLNQNASGSICPKGWYLPVGNSGGDFDNLAKAYGNGTDQATSLALQAKPVPNFVLSGYYQDSAAHDQGIISRLYSSTSAGNRSTDYLAYGFRADDSGVAATYNNWGRGRGNSIRCIARERIIQNVAEWGADVEEHEIVIAKDERDGNNYKVTRLRDGKLWMIDNLRLGDSKLTNRNLTSSNTDITASSYTLPNSSTSGFNDSTAQNIYVPDSASGDYKVEYGGYYTWMAATAGTGSSSGNASSSICPKGWRLPIGGSGGEFQTMASKYNSNSGNSMLHDTNEIPGFYLAGNYYSSSPNNQGSYGYYWSSTASDSGNAYFLRLLSGGAYPTYYGSKNNGFSIRCVAQE